MSGQPSPSKSRKAQPGPMVSGRYCFPKAPLLCLKRTPAATVTSVKTTGGAAVAARPRAVISATKKAARILSVIASRRPLPPSGVEANKTRGVWGAQGFPQSSAPQLDERARDSLPRERGVWGAQGFPQSSAPQLDERARDSL